MLLRLVNKQACSSTDLGLSLFYLLLLLPPLVSASTGSCLISALLVFVMFLALIWTGCVMCVCACAHARMSVFMLLQEII